MITRPLGEAVPARRSKRNRRRQREEFYYTPSDYPLFPNGRLVVQWDVVQHWLIAVRGIADLAPHEVMQLVQPRRVRRRYLKCAACRCRTYGHVDAAVRTGVADQQGVAQAIITTFPVGRLGE